MSTSRRTNEHQAIYTRQATILRKNLMEWDRMLRTPRGEDWPTMIGRANAAFNQTNTMDKYIEDVMEHFVFVPKRTTANPQDIPFFLSTRLEIPVEEEYNDDHNNNNDDNNNNNCNDTTTRMFNGDPVERLTTYERNAAKLAAQYEESMIRF